MERMEQYTSCPECSVELDDDDGEFFDGMSGEKECPSCGLEIEYVKQLKRTMGNPYCDFEWSETYMKWEDEQDEW